MSLVQLARAEARRLRELCREADEYEARAGRLRVSADLRVTVRSGWHEADCWAALLVRRGAGWALDGLWPIASAVIERPEPVEVPHIDGAVRLRPGPLAVDLVAGHDPTLAAALPGVPRLVALRTSSGAELAPLAALLSFFSGNWLRIYPQYV